MCHGSKLTHFLAITKLTNSLGKQKLELSIPTLSGRAPLKQLQLNLYASRVKQIIFTQLW